MAALIGFILFLANAVAIALFAKMMFRYNAEKDYREITGKDEPLFDEEFNDLAPKNWFKVAPPAKDKKP
jgi:hypothetical protein